MQIKSFSAKYFSDAIQSQISNLAKKQVLLCGIETHICVLQTASDLINNGYDVFILNECVSSRNESDMRMGISRLKKFGCSIITHEMLAFELLKSSTHPKTIILRIWPSNRLIRRGPGI